MTSLKKNAQFLIIVCSRALRTVRAWLFKSFLIPCVGEGCVQRLLKVGRCADISKGPSILTLYLSQHVRVQLPLPVLALRKAGSNPLSRQIRRRYYGSEFLASKCRIYLPADGERNDNPSSSFSWVCESYIQLGTDGSTVPLLPS